MSSKKLYRATFTFDGVRYDISASTEDALRDKVIRRKRDLEEGKKTISRNSTLNEWFSQYVEIYKKQSVGYETYKTIKGHYKNWIQPYLGKMLLKNIKPIHCQKALNNLIGKSKSTNDKVTQLLRNLMETAVDNDLLLTNPMKGISVPDYYTGGHRQITDGERDLILKTAGTNQYGLWILVMLYCGLRPGETARIQMRHINLAERKLYVDGTKTKAAKRYVPIPDPLASELSKIKKGPFEYLFVQKRTGRPLTKTVMRNMWKNFKRDMNINSGCRVFRNEVLPPFAVADDLTPYCLRHTYCTDLQDAGVPINIAKELMGHTSIETTSKYYTHFTDKAFQSAADKINQFIS